MSPTTDAGTTQGPGNFVHIYIDNSNLWIQGQKTYAEKKGLDVGWDPTWRFDVGRLKAILTKSCGPNPSNQNSSKPSVSVNLYGSTPPPVDTVWRAIESHNVNVRTFARSSWTGQEKEVDCQIIADSVEDSVKAFGDKHPSEFIIVSGDRDLLSAVQKIVSYDFRVHVWSWKNCLSGAYQEASRDSGGLVQVHLLDDHLEEIGFHETTFRVDRNTISPRSIVVLDPLPKADEIKSLVSSLGTPVYHYVFPDKRADASSEDLVIIPTGVSKMTATELDGLFWMIKGRLEPLGLGVLTYLEYDQLYQRRDSGGESQAKLALSNRFQELSEAVDIDNDHDDYQDAYGGRNGRENDRLGQPGRKDDDDAGHGGFVEVNYRTEKRKKSQRQAEQKSRSRCVWREYCRHALNCKYGHTKEEEERFKAYPLRKARKVKHCNWADCTDGQHCYYAHGDEELFCPTCGATGIHKMRDCPQR